MRDIVNIFILLKRLFFFCEPSSVLRDTVSRLREVG